MLSKKVLKDIQSLGLKKHRDESALFLAEGPKVVGELLKTVPGKIEGLFATEEWILAHKEYRELATTVSAIELERISTLKTPHQVLAVVQQFDVEEPVMMNEWVLYLDTIQDPGNLGTIIRIADWFGLKKIVCSAGCVDVYNPKVIQSTMASIARVAVWYDRNGDWLARQKAPIYAAVLDGASIYQKQHCKEGVLLIGNESKGLHPELLALATHRVMIPRIGAAESLNAAVATGIILSHVIAIGNESL